MKTARPHPRPTLLEQARLIPAPKPNHLATPEDVELAIAWAKGEITMAQVTTVLKQKPGGASIYVFLTHALAQAIRNIYARSVNDPFEQLRCAECLGETHIPEDAKPSWHRIGHPRPA